MISKARRLSTLYISPSAMHRLLAYIVFACRIGVRAARHLRALQIVATRDVVKTVVIGSE